MSGLSSTQAKAAEYREGYLWKAESVNDSGVRIDSSFLLTAQNKKKINLTEVEGKYQITPQVEFTLSQTAEGIRFTPKKPLKENSIYALEWKGIPWLFQTEQDFRLEAVLPMHETTDVPTDTGIEFKFSSAGAKDVEKYIEISPKTEGRFENKENLVVFIPKKRLEPKTIYTVTVKQGLPLDKSDKKLKETVTFQFETAEQTSSLDWEKREILYFNNWIQEIGTKDKPVFEINHYAIAEQNETLKVKLEVYRYRDADEYIRALGKKNAIPTWSRYTDLTIPKDNMQKMLKIEQELSFDQNRWSYIAELPAPLPAGYYLVEVSKGKLVDQSFLQITDISSFYQESKTENVLWLHKVVSQELLANAEVISYQTEENAKPVSPKEIERIKTDKDGIALLKKKAEGATVLKIKSGEMESVMFYKQYDYYPFFWKQQRSEKVDYWSMMYTDRKLYKKDDEVNFFGFMMPKYQGDTNRNLSSKERLEEVKKHKKLSVEIAQHSWYRFGDAGETPFAKVEVAVNNGFFKGKLQLPNLSPGSYQILVKDGEELIHSGYLSVEDYVKPAYKVNVSKTRQAVFWNEPLEFEVQTSFFEGTPVGELDFHYMIGAWKSQDGQGKTDRSGKAIISYQSKPGKAHNHLDYGSISVFAKLPESAEIYGHESFRIFLKNINLDATSKIKDGKGKLEGNVHKIVLDRLNNGTAKDEYDFLGDALAGHSVDMVIYRNEWVKKEVGQEYDYINKIVRKVYEWHLEKKVLESRTLTTDKNGKFSFEKEMPKKEQVYYTAVLKTKDLAGNPIEMEKYFHTDNYVYNEYRMKALFEKELVFDKPRYQVGDTVHMEFRRNGSLASDKQLLYIVAQNGLRKVFVAGSKVSLPFTEQEVPNTAVVVYGFEGYITKELARGTMLFDIDSKQLQIKATTDKKEYRPGEIVKVLIEVTDQTGKPVPAGKVHIKAIDEALLSLSDVNDSPLYDLYREVSSGLSRSYSSHQEAQSMWERGYVARNQMEFKTAEAPMAKDEAKEEKGVSGEGDYVREEFLDLAVFDFLELNEQGKATFSFKVPDNITSWRIFFTAFNQELMAGSKTENVSVTLPFFINTALNKSYLLGDEINIGMAAYGKELTAASAIDYQVYLGNKKIAGQKGKAYEKVSVALPKFAKEGEYEVIIKATSDTGQKDAVKIPVSILKTYHQKMVSKTLPAKKGMKISSNQIGLTTVYFTDREKSKYLAELGNLSYYYGERIDQRVVAKLASQLLQKFTPETEPIKEEIKLSQYQKGDGGLSILPYSASAVEITVHMLPLLIEKIEHQSDQINRVEIKNYLERIWLERNAKDTAKVLYGLAVLGEPILDRLQRIETLSTLSEEDKIYLALAYAELGDSYRAKEIFTRVVAPKLEEYEKWVRYKAENEDKTYFLSALSMLLAQQIGDSRADKLFRYQREHYSATVYTGAAQMLYLKRALAKVDATNAKVIYRYLGKETTVEPKAYPIGRTIPSQNLKNIEILSVTGKVDVVLLYKEYGKLKSSPDQYLQVNREYYVGGKKTDTFKEGDIVEVRLTWNISPDAPRGTYRITDYVPAGLAPVEKDYVFLRYQRRGWWWQDIENQTVSIYVARWENERSKDRTHSYYARVVSPGKFKAEGIIMQGMYNKDHLFVGEDSFVTIEKLKK